MVRSVAEIHNAPGLGQGIGGGTWIDAEAELASTLVLPRQTPPLCLVCVLLFFLVFCIFYIFLLAQLCIYALDGAEVEAKKVSISSLVSSSE